MALTGCFAADLADAVTADVNAAEFSQAFTATRPKTWKIHYSQEDLKTLRVTIVPAPVTVDVETRDEDLLLQSIDIGVQQRVGQTGDCDPLGRLAEELRDHFHGMPELTVGTQIAHCRERRFVAPENAMVAKQHLEDLGVFTAVLRTVWEVIGKVTED